MRAVFVVAPLLLVACADQPATSSGSQSVTTKNRLASNRLASNRLASNRLASNRLASNRLASNRLASNMLSSSDLLSTYSGRTVYSYLVSCAVPEGITLEADIPGASDTSPDDPFTCSGGHCSFPGGVGIAPEWLNHRLERKGQEWVSSCVFARVNAHDTAEAISLRGKSPALSISADEAALYTVEEGAFYGNLFSTDGDTDGDDDDHKHDSSAASIAWFACEGEGQASGEFGGLVVRDCTEPMACKPDRTCDPTPACDPSQGPCAPLTCGNDGLCHDSTKAVITQCGFNWAGFCADYTPQYPSPYACESFDAAGGFYGDCHDAPGQGKWKHIKEWDRVITTYVTP